LIGKQTDHGFAWRGRRGEVHELLADVVNVLDLHEPEQPDAVEPTIREAMNSLLRGGVGMDSFNVQRVREVHEFLRNGYIVHVLGRQFILGHGVHPAERSRALPERRKWTSWRLE
jgi:hypothetical protein